MPGGSKKLPLTAADSVLDSILNDVPAAEPLPTTSGSVPLPPVQPAEFKAHPAADALLDTILGAPPAEPAKPVAQPTTVETPAAGNADAIPQPPAEKPWYSILADQLRKPPGNFELLSNAKPEDFAAGVGGLAHSASAHTLDPFPKERQAADPTSQRAMDIAGAAPLLAVPGGAAAQAAVAGGFGGVREFNDTAGQPLGDRLKSAGGQALHDATVSGALHGAGQGLNKLGANATTAGEAFVPQIFMTPQQRAMLQVRKGPDALSKLGRDVIDAGLLKPTNPLGYVRPASASRVAINADRVREETGKSIDEFRQDLVDRGVNPDVEIKNIVHDLRGKANEAGNGIDLESPKDARIYNKQANRLERPEALPVAGKVVSPPPVPTWYAKLRTPPATPPAQPELPGVATAPRPGPSPQLELPTPVSEPMPPGGPEQMAMDLPQAPKPEPWKPGDLRSAEQLGMDVSLPPGQRNLPLDEQGQRALPFDQSRIAQPVPMPPGAEQAPLFPGQYPAGGTPGAPRATQIDELLQSVPGLRTRSGPPGGEGTAVGSPVPAPEIQEPQQLPIDLATQRELPLPEPTPKPEPWKPGDLRSAEQLQMPGMNRPIGSQMPAPYTMNPKQAAMDLPPRREGPQYSETPLEAEGQLSRESLPLSDAIVQAKDLAKRIKFDRNPNAVKQSYARDVARNFTWGGLRDQIDRALEREAAAGNIQPKPFEKYKQDMKNHSVAATAEEPAFRVAEQQNQAGLNMKDLAVGMALGRPGPAAVAKATDGMLPATMSRALRMTGGGLKAAGAAAQGAARLAPILRAQQANPGAPKNVVEEHANDDMKKDLQERLRNR